ncbi:hypothetical protein KM472_gp227 [Cynomolgus macaque cytomegalovirus strain Ottawa]|uniref:Uncharacterized protein n=1 Tax=macacine betaherpesvirus 8 TaxID=2560567 RepID=G8H0V6_9BETA|nr:hypothetical protein KM472_gp227 [Cynomolgus macaque cytomegalovirus strain Ottawa]AEQ32304.1 hypothetical protein cy215 [Cynomolgus macaque cytomegalovirus strain Ottawa]
MCFEHVSARMCKGLLFIRHMYHTTICTSRSSHARLATGQLAITRIAHNTMHHYILVLSRPVLLYIPLGCLCIPVCVCKFIRCNPAACSYGLDNAYVNDT